MPQIQCSNLTLGYDGKVIVSGLEFSVSRGDYLCILGENGSGKTTLMKAILGLQNQLGGEILYGDDLKKNEIGYLPQQTVVQRDFPASVYEIVISGCQNRRGLKPFYSKVQKEEALRIMEKVGIAHLKKRCYKELSGGQQQRVLLARALLATGKILLLDEPVSGLDPVATAEFYSLIKKLNSEDKITIIMISHDIYAAKQYASHILHIGKNQFFGRVGDYTEDSLLNCSQKGNEM